MWIFGLSLCLRMGRGRVEMEWTGNRLSGLICSRAPRRKVGMRKRKSSVVKIDLEIKMIALAGINDIPP